MKLKENRLKSILITYIWDPANEGVFWFAVFFAFIALFKYAMYSTDIVSQFQISINDIAISSLGFVNIFLIRFSKSLFKYKNDL